MPHGMETELGELSYQIPTEAQKASREMASLLDDAHDILVMGHAGADGDVAGSSLALGLMLHETGKSVAVYNAEPWPLEFTFLPGQELLIASLEGRRFDATVVVDAGEWSRVGVDDAKREQLGAILWIDHHRNDDPPGDLNYIDLSAASVGEQLYEIFKVMKYTPSAEVATALYVSLVSDTGAFRYRNASARAFRMAGDLVECGLKPERVAAQLYESRSHAKARAIGQALSTFKVSPCGRFASAYLSPDFIEHEGIALTEMHGVVNELRALRGVEVAMLIQPDTQHNIRERNRVIMRSAGMLSCAKVAKEFDAKGNKFAASWVTSASQEDLQDLWFEACLRIWPRT